MNLKLIWTLIAEAYAATGHYLEKLDLSANNKETLQTHQMTKKIAL